MKPPLAIEYQRPLLDRTSRAGRAAYHRALLVFAPVFFFIIFPLCSKPCTGWSWLLANASPPGLLVIPIFGIRDARRGLRQDLMKSYAVIGLVFHSLLLVLLTAATIGVVYDIIWAFRFNGGIIPIANR
jgi:hypothetical protein